MTVLAARYELRGMIGEGGMGRVWRAHDLVLDRVVAVKRVTFPEGVSADERMVLCRRAVREARAAAAVRHPSIVAVHDVLEEDGVPCVVMELVEGRSLREALPVPPREAARIGLAVLSALTAAHAAGVVHRDVTPGNVLLADDGRVVLTDFGIAAVSGAEALTRTGVLVGAPGFLPPERLSGGVHGPEGDIFSLGATLYAAVNGHGPFRRATEAATLAATVLDRPPRLRGAGPLGGLLARMLRKDPATRPRPARIERTLRRAAGERVSWWERAAWLPDVRWEYGWLVLVAAVSSAFLFADLAPYDARYRGLDVCAVAASMPSVVSRDPEPGCSLELSDGRTLTVYWWDTPNPRAGRVEYLRARERAVYGKVTTLPRLGDAAFATGDGVAACFRDGALVVRVSTDKGDYGPHPRALWEALRKARP
ncbi:serine/threonine-protein kinase [Actinocorallia sp. A-T 12471]|uniref:serine/threonine-protein kinase n=1 Tax=Actinocorallia sp. A-T 12471 TaxID=3089813 RepID=UPI0029D2E418|nr:serine/threonine-protein kinase [Actinocorallia sp. A-T 12471]MDX6742134.1 serine/threonine-protein kinase [Actinocorallia sp. A-T 12471]